jgi:cysteine-rich repeat protein
LLALAVQAQAATVQCTIPDENVERTRALCEEIRKEKRIATGDWGDPQCASMLFRDGVFAREQKSREAEAQKTVQGYVTDNVNTFQATWPAISGVVCGDSVWVPEFEGCDDGNLENGDGCSNVCEEES